MASTEPKIAVDRDLRVLRLDHFNVPVRDLNVARKFYCEVLGGEVAVEPDWAPYQAGRGTGAHINFQVFNEDGHLIAYWQPSGQPAPDQLFPHRAFRVKDAAKLGELVGRLTAAAIPNVLVTQRVAEVGDGVPVSLYFRDPDGNQLELICGDYPFRSGIEVGTFDLTMQYYRWVDWRAMVPDGGAPPLSLTPSLRIRSGQALPRRGGDQ